MLHPQYTIMVLAPLVKLISQHSINRLKLKLLTNWLNIFKLSAKTSTPATLSNGGGDNVKIGPTSTAWFVMFFVFPVCTAMFSMDVLKHLPSGSAVAVEQIFSGGRDTISV
jgi:hypothetical protein